MYHELRITHPQLNIEILGINEVGLEVGNPVVVEGRTLPWLQDVDIDGDTLSDVWENLWDATWRDVVILNAKNEKVDVYNLSLNDLKLPDKYDTLRQKLIDAATVTNDTPWQNTTNPLDTNNDTFVSPLDALLILNELNSVGGHALDAPASGSQPPPFIDTNGDNFVSPLDALLVINQLNAASATAAIPATVAARDATFADAGGEGEAASLISHEVDLPTPTTILGRHELAVSQIAAAMASRDDHLGAVRK